ncbi:MAG: alpha/beta hydrolase [Polymorphobacter sp.]|uniref:alpha/beta hydrolase n=1 Tax=Polymorphobacter sp. TaxID=1909290 RepID=UPI003A84733E
MSDVMRSAEGLAYRHVAGAGPLIVFLPGYMSDMTGGKATALFDWAQARGRAALLLDYSGCGASAGDFLAGSISRWTGDVLRLIEMVAPGGQVVLVGSSMGGWVALRAGVRLGARLAGLVGVAAAPDFVDWGLDVSPAEAAALTAQGFFSRASGYGGDYLYSRAFLEDAPGCRMLAGPIGISAPVRLLHGQRDEVVPWRLSLEIAELVTAEDVQVTLIKDGDHRLSREADIARLTELVAGLC